VLDALDEGVLLTDVSGEVVFANAAVRRLCAPAGAELSAERLPAPEVARRLARVLRPIDPREPHAGPRAAFAAASTVLRQVGPPHRVFERTEVVQPAADGGVLGIAAIYRDITDRRTERVRNDRFLTSVAHELRTPLACITGHAGLLDQRLPGLAAGQPDEAAARRAHDSTSRSLRAIRRQVARMDRLLGDVLDTAQLERGTLALQVEEMDVVSLVRTLVDDVAEMAPKHRVDLDLPPVLVARCDATRVEHIIYNLLSNATRFSPAGGVIRVTLATDGGLSASAAPGRFLVLTIGDDGPGIPPEASERIFERYASHDTAVAREVPGLGIRLAISRALAERHGGTLRVLAAGPEHAGGTFELRLPLA
jgi:signal transduction histidine kinase